MKNFATFARRWHRRLSVVIGVQLLLWTLSGLIFALLPIEEVRGEDLQAAGTPQLRVDMAEMTRAEAVDAARLALLAPPELLSAEIIYVAPGEYRGGPLPAWKVDFADDLTLYLDPLTAEVNAVRTTKWRIFDFFWMLHIMDYDDRDDFNHPLLIIAASFGVLTSFSGLLLTFVIYRQRLGRRKQNIS